jgi:hypothetical protein
MIEIKYNNVFLDVANNESSEIERNSPLFLLDNILAEYTTPISFLYTDKNSRELGYYFFDTTVKIKRTLTVQVYDNGTFRYNASMVIESAGMNFNLPGKGTATGYLLIGISNFFQQIKDKMLRSLTLGGDRVFTYTTADPLDMSAGYWQHFQSTYDFTSDYVMLPCLNDAFTDDDLQFTFANGWMNKYDGEKIAVYQPVVPWPKLEYVLNQIFEEVGWTLDTSGIIDTEWKKLLLYSNYTIPTTYYGWDGDNVTTLVKPSVTINLANAMPEGITCSKFIFEICKRYLWAPLFDTSSNTCRLVALKDLGNVTPVDYTIYADAGSSSQFSLAEKVFAFKNNFVGEDELPSEVNLTEWTRRMWRYSELDLPNLVDGNYDDTLAFTYLENKFWRVDWDPSGHVKQWIQVCDNIYNSDPGNATDTFETDVTTLPLRKKQLDNGHWSIMPAVSQVILTKWGIRTVIYHGMVHQVDEDGSPLDLLYPLGSPINVPPGRTPVLDWSNVYEHTDFENEFGIIEYWARKWMQLIANTEEITQRFYLPLHVLSAFAWDKIILIRSIGYLVKGFVEPLPYNGFIEAKLQKVNIVANALPTPPDEQTDVHFTDNPTLSADDYTYVALQYLKGPAGAVVTITITTLTKSNALLYFKVNDTEYFSVGDTFNVTLDGSGDGFYNVKCGGIVPPGNAIFVIVTITSVDIGAIGTPFTHGYDKVIG